MAISADEFMASLSRSGILPADEVSSIANDRTVDRTVVCVEHLARDLVRKKKITGYQAATLCKGSSDGLVFGDYVLLEKIGSGATAQVFLARHRSRSEAVALKLLRDDDEDPENAVLRFRREAETLATLNHANIVKVLEWGEHNGIHYMVMTYVAGRNLHAIVKEQGPRPVRQALNLIRQSARGVEYFHAHGIVHRDIKPSNLLVDGQGVLTILDLGLARLDDTTDAAPNSSEGRLTVPGQMMGTVNYVAPEQTCDAHEVDGRADIYALGCTLYFLVAGQPPYARENPALTMLAHAEAEIPSLRAASPQVSERLEAAFRRMLAKSPADRFPTMTAVVAELDACDRELAPVQGAAACS